MLIFRGVHPLDPKKSHQKTSRNITRLSMFVPYTFWETKPQMVPTDLYNCFFHLSRVLRRCKPIGLVNYVVYPHVSPRSSEYKPEMFVYPKQHFWLWVMSHDYGLITPEDLWGYWELIYSYTYDFLPIL